jgi:hypothetical protein
MGWKYPWMPSINISSRKVKLDVLDINAAILTIGKRPAYAK